MASESMGVVMPVAEPSTPARSVTFRLCDGLRFVPQRGSGDWHCIIESPKHQRFFRIGRSEYLIASSVDGFRDSSSIVQRLADSNPEMKIDGAIVEQVVRWLLSSGLVQPVRNAESQGEAPKQAAAASNGGLIDPFMFRIPILSGSSLDGFAKQLHFLCSKVSVIVSFVIMLAGLVSFLSNSSHFLQLSAKLFVPSAALWWLGAWFLLKIVHELGHALVCSSHGGKLRGAGIASFYFAPVPYVDTTDMWRLPERRSRAFCAAGGMWFEMIVSAIAILVCQAVENPTLQYFCISIVTMGAFTTLAFNANPLTRFDGYYILSDTIDRPNLWSDGQNAWKSLWSDKAFLLSSTLSVHGLPLLAYGTACFVNRMLMMIGLAWGAWLTYRGLGLGLIALASYLWFVVPFLRSRKVARAQAAMSAMLGQAPSQKSLRSKYIRWGFSIAGVAITAFLASVLPSPFQPLSPGFVSYGDSNTLRAQSDGIIVEVFQSNDTIVQAGDPIARLENPTLKLECEKLRSNLESAEERCRVLRAQLKMPELQVEQARMEAIQQQLAQVELQLAQLIITAPESGRLIARTLQKRLGQFVKVGQPLATLAANQALEVHCSIDQTDVEAYRQHVGRETEIFLSNNQRLIGTLTEVRPRGSESLENPALAAKYGGPIPVHLTNNPSDKEHPLKTHAPRFEARLTFNSPLTEPLTPGQLCRVGIANRQVSIAGLLDRWKNAFVEWVKPVEAKT